MGSSTASGTRQPAPEPRAARLTYCTPAASLFLIAITNSYY